VPELPEDDQMAEMKPELLEILACPKCKSPVVQKEQTLCCTGSTCGLIYPIRDGIPVMLIEEATPPGQSGEDE